MRFGASEEGAVVKCDGFIIFLVLLSFSLPHVEVKQRKEELRRDI
jgi:hypothetical protein